MRKFFGISLFAATAVLAAGPAAADMWNIDFDTGLAADGQTIVDFAPDTIFSHPYSDTKWQRYDGLGGGGNPADGGIPGSNGVKVKIDVWNGRGEEGFAVGFDSNNTGSRDSDLQHPGAGFDNILIIQSHEASYTRNCGGGLYGSGRCFSDSYGHVKSDDEAYGGDIVFEFDREVTLIKMNYFDIERWENRPNAKVKFFDEYDNLVFSKKILPTVPDGGVGLLTFNGDIGVKAHKMMVWLPGSGAIDNIMGNVDTMTQIAEPSVLALFGVGLFAMGAYRRRRAVTTPDA